MTDYVNPLDRITEGRTLPEGCTTWAIRSVRPDLQSSNGYRYPWPGNWAEAPGPCTPSNDPCPSRPGDGICAGHTWRGMASGGIPAITLLLVAYGPDDVLANSAEKVRLRRMYVVDIIDGTRLYLTRADLTGANLTGADLAYANLTDANLTRADLTEARGLALLHGRRLTDGGIAVRT